MTNHLGRGKGIAVLLAVVCGLSSQLSLLAGPQPAQTSAVAILAAGPPLAEPGTKGDTYFSLERQASRVITAFVDGTKAVADRAFDGTLTVRLEDRAGNELNRLTVSPADAINEVLTFQPFGTAPVVARVHASVHQTLDWTSQQSHRLHQDGVVSGTKVEWKNGLMRSSRATASTDADNDREVRAMETYWAKGLVARTVRVPVAPGTTGNGKPITGGDILATSLHLDGVEVGSAHYVTSERMFSWRMPGVSEGAIGSDQLKQKYGGWRFTPDLVWMNLQTLATFHWRSLMKDKGTVARRTEPRRNPVLQFFAPVLAANDDGCDSLHYLDGTIYRACCDQHDRCYSQNGCGATSWWYWGGWSCTYCNVTVVGCFVAAGYYKVYSPYGG
jgi:hypothetical protein